MYTDILTQYPAPRGDVLRLDGPAPEARGGVPAANRD
jgi:hypothetical protein